MHGLAQTRVPSDALRHASICATLCTLCDIYDGRTEEVGQRHLSLRNCHVTKKFHCRTDSGIRREEFKHR